MQQAAKLQFERVVREFARWRAVPEGERPPAPGWWWGPALELELVGAPQPMPPAWCARLELPIGASFDDGAKALLASLADQTSLTWPDSFPGMAKHADQEEQEI